MAEKRLITPEELAKQLGVAVKSLANQRSLGEGPPFIKIGRLVRYDPTLTEEWLARCVRNAP